jgi:YfiR/HmsC-like
MKARPGSRATLARYLGPWLMVLSLCFSARVGAEDVAVPISLQMDLLLKVASYDKNLNERVHDSVRVAVLQKTSDADSGRSAAEALKALSSTDDMDGVPLERVSTTYTDGPALARVIRESNIAILYVTPGFTESEMDAIALALDGVSVLSSGALSKYTTRGVVLGFDLVGGKPKLLVNLAVAKRQRVELSSSVLKLMRVVE